MATTALYPHISLDSNGRAWVDGANVKVIEVAADYLAHGSSVEEMSFQHPHLGLSMIHAALAYFHDHREEMESALASSLDASRKKVEAGSTSPLRSRLGIFPD